ncbi:MAG: DUF1499 domain-containing protein [Gammaproteobacteria bacterium]|jgi:uncharacterized protein (DUF1499 family)|nr:DUF1499 domain-containing protein [Gammaproteobacteria bacterium]
MWVKLLIGLAVLPLLYLVVLLVLAQLSRSGEPAGLVEGRLVPCPARPNCVCSEHPADARNTIDPLPLSGADGPRALRAAIVAAGGQISRDDGDYLAASFRSAFFGFVDDLEARVDVPGGVIHLRSASRVGSWDRGVNRQRVEQIREHMAASRPNQGDSKQ